MHPVSARLVELGRAGVGGFVDDDGMLVRRVGTDLDAWSAPIAIEQAIAWIVSLADALAACEQRALFPGPLHAVVRGDRLELAADALVHAIVGAPAPDEPAPKWGPPEGGVPDNAANRYALGIVAYRLVTGEHPFAGRGLRAGLDDQVRGAPPFAASVQCPAGLQSVVLRMLDPDPARRFASAAAIASAVRALVTRGPSQNQAEIVSSTRATATSIAAAATDSTSNVALGALVGDARSRPTLGSSAARRLVVLAPLAIGVALAIVVAKSVTAPPITKVAAASPAPLRAASKLDDCATCHPRQAAEWSRSVMAHALDSPLFGALEALIEEQVGKDRFCPDGAGILRAAGPDACVDRRTGVAITGAGGPGWCVNCHAPGSNLDGTSTAWRSGARVPAPDLLRGAGKEGISCAACHETTGPVHPGDAYEGNPSWISPDTGARFSQRPEDARGLFGIANSGYSLDPASFLRPVDGLPHARTSPETAAYRASSEFCGACHDVRLFGTDTLRPDEHFKRLRDAYSEWAAWADGERRAGRTPSTCQDCHMSLYPGVCEPAPGRAAAGGCPNDTAFSPRKPGSRASGHASAMTGTRSLASHYFTSVDVPLTASFDDAALDDATVDVSGVPVGARARRDQLLASAFRFAVDAPSARDGKLSIPIVVENIGAGHRVPAGFSQEREIWVHLRVTDAGGRVVYEVGRVDRGDEDLHDKVFVQVSTSDLLRDRLGRPLGLFGADVADGPDVPRWDAQLHGRGLINFQNGFLRCVRCIGTIDDAGKCQPAPGQEGLRALRYADGDYDLDTGECRSNLSGANALFETYFPVGSLDASRGLLKGPDAIVNTRSLPPNTPARYVYELDAPGPGPFTVEATLEFRAFPPYLVRAFADYEAAQAAAGKRPSGPLVDAGALDRLEIVHVATAKATIP